MDEKIEKLMDDAGHAASEKVTEAVKKAMERMKGPIGDIGASFGDREKISRGIDGVLAVVMDLAKEACGIGMRAGIETTRALVESVVGDIRADMKIVKEAVCAGKRA